ncbi:MAG TPA: hypothetical protein VGI20_14875 [Rhizomicrobium sp.]|jgi:hypothetical protein
MRNAIAGGILGLALIGALFAAAHHRESHSQVAVSARALPPGEIAAGIKPGFTGIQHIGAWDLVCLKHRQIPAWARSMRPAAGASGAATAPPVFHCHVVTKLGGTPGQWADVNFQLVGPKRSLLTYLKFAPGLNAIGDYLNVHLNQTDVRFRVVLCGPKECAAFPVIHPEDSVETKSSGPEEIVAAGKAALMLPASFDGKPVPLKIPLYGLQEAISALRRAEQKSN